VRLLEQNQGISGATNAAIAMVAGDFIGFIDHDDLLKPHALAEVARRLVADPTIDLVYTDEDKMDVGGRLISPFFKPDWSPEHLTSRNYMSHLTVARRSLVEQVGGLRSGFDGSQDHDLVLRLSELTDRVEHVAEPLYTWRQVPGSTAAVVDAKPYAFDASKRALDEALVRRGYTGQATDGILASTYRLRYDVIGSPKVTIIIPTRNGEHLLRRAIDSVRNRSTYTNYEFLVVDNESDDPGTLAYLATFGGRVLRYPHRFNYARMMNLASWAADGDLLLYLNNDTEVIEPGWMEALIEHAQRPEVGAVGCRLYYPDDRIQHEGIVVNYCAGAAGNIDHGGWWGFGDVVRDCTAVTGAVTMMRPSVFHEIGGFEERLRVAFNDVDLCLRVRQAGYRVVYTPYATLYHHESATRGYKAHLDDDAFFDARWEPRSEQFHDPYYNINLDRSRPFVIAGAMSAASAGEVLRAQ
jgi:GT2 family glycosyltransferase